MAVSVDIVIPVFNEADTVEELFARLGAACPQARLVFVDNASTDGTLGILERLPGVRLVRHSSNLGYGRSLLDGIAASDGERIIMIDGDLEYHPEDVPAVVDALTHSAAVYASRFLGHSLAEPVMPLTRRVGNGVVTAVFNALYGQRLTDLCTGLRGVQRSALPPRGLGEGFEMALQLAALMSEAGVRIAEVPVRYTPRTRGRSKMRHIPEFVKFAHVLVDIKVRSRKSRGGRPGSTVSHL